MMRPAALLIPLLLSGCGWFDFLDPPKPTPTVSPAQARAIAYDVVRQAERDRGPAPVDPALQARLDRVDALEQRLERLDEAVARNAARPVAQQPPPRAVEDNETPQVLARVERVERRVIELQQQIDTVAKPLVVQGRRGLHLASYRGHDAALRGWERLRARHGRALAGLEPVLVEVETLGGRFVRLVTGIGLPDDRADDICRAIRARGDYCLNVPVDG